MWRYTHTLYSLIYATHNGDDAPQKITKNLTILFAAIEPIIFVNEFYAKFNFRYIHLTGQKNVYVEIIRKGLKWNIWNKVI